MNKILQNVIIFIYPEFIQNINLAERNNVPPKQGQIANTTKKINAIPSTKKNAVNIKNKNVKMSGKMLVKQNTKKYAKQL